MVAIVAAQEVQWVFSAKNRSTQPGVANFEFVKEERRVGVYYFYVLDRRLRAGLHQAVHLLPVSRQGVAQRS